MVLFCRSLPCVTLTWSDISFSPGPAVMIVVRKSDVCVNKGIVHITKHSAAWNGFRFDVVCNK